MKTVYKYPLNRGRVTTINLPAGYKILTVDMDANKDICVWIELDPDVPNSECLLLDYVGTGWAIEGNPEYIGSVFDSDMYVWHVYKEV